MVSAMANVATSGRGEELQCNLCHKFLKVGSEEQTKFRVRMHELGVGRHEDEIKRLGLPLDSRSFGYKRWVNGVEQN